MLKIFGFRIGKEEELPESVQSFAPPENDGAMEIAEGGAYGTTLDLSATVKDETLLITKYREMAASPECERAIDDIINECVVLDDHESSVSIVLDDIELPESIKKKIVEEFDFVLGLMDFNTRGYDIFKNFYVDGRINYHKMIDTQSTKLGIQELRYIDPRKIKKVRIEKIDGRPLGQALEVTPKKYKEYYIYSPKGIQESQQGLKIAKDSIAYCNSGIFNETNSMVLSHLHKAIKPLNQLKTLEDATVIYRLARAPERRVFYIDVGNLPKAKAEQYLRDMMAKHKNKLVYDATTGDVRTDRKFMTMLEDFWLPRREGCFSLNTKIDLLDGRSVELGQLIVEYKSGKENWVYSIDRNTGSIVPGLISWAGVTRTDTQVVKVTLDNGEVITCTPDHKMILRNGKLSEAKNLEPGTSLMPMYSTDDQMFDLKDEQWVPKITESVYYIIYKTTNLVNGKYYIGKHKQVGIGFDGYLGSGTALKKAIEKYGEENFKRETLYYFESEAECLQKEYEIVNEDFVSANDNYNIIPGGYGGSYERDFEHRNKMSELKKGIPKSHEHKQKLSDSVKQFYNTEEGLIRRELQREFNKSSEVIWEALKKGRDAIKQLRENDKQTLSKEEYLSKWSPGLSLMGRSGTEAAAEKIRNDRIRLSEAEFKEKYAIKGKFRRDEHEKRCLSISLEDTINVIRNLIEDNPRVSNEEILRNLDSFYSLTSLRNYLSFHGYETISDVVVRNVDDKYIVQKRRQQARSINNHKVVSVEFIDTPMDVGTLTIDENHLFHDHHNFALSSGVFVMNSRGTEITTLPPGQNLGELSDVEYFRRKLYESLNVPISRMEADGQFNLGRSSEITRDEIKFSRFVSRLRNKFSELFLDILRTQVLLKGIVTKKEWDEIQNDIRFDFRKDNHFAELKETEILRERLALLDAVDTYVGRYYSTEWIKKNVLRQSDEEIKEIEKQIKTAGEDDEFDSDKESEFEPPDTPFETAEKNREKEVTKNGEQ